MRQHDVIKTADWVLDLGPGGGVNGGRIVVEGTPEQVAACPDSFTGQYLKPLLERAVRPEPVEGLSSSSPKKTRRSSRAKSRDADADQPDLIGAK